MNVRPCLATRPHGDSSNADGSLLWVFDEPPTPLASNHIYPAPAFIVRMRRFTFRCVMIGAQRAMMCEKFVVRALQSAV